MDFSQPYNRCRVGVGVGGRAVEVCSMFLRCMKFYFILLIAVNTYLPVIMVCHFYHRNKNTTTP